VKLTKIQAEVYHGSHADKYTKQLDRHLTWAVVGHEETFRTVQHVYSSVANSLQLVLYLAEAVCRKRKDK